MNLLHTKSMKTNLYANIILPLPLTAVHSPPPAGSPEILAQLCKPKSEEEHVLDSSAQRANKKITV
jgi:hypothetical protein